MLSDKLKEALQIEQYEHGICRHKDAEHCYNLVIAGAVWRAEEELSEEDYEDALKIVVDETLSGLVLKGYLSAGGLTEDGELFYEATEKGREALEDGKE